MIRRALLAFAFASGLAACGTDSEPAPVKAVTPPIQDTAGGATGRTVGYRNPLGHVQVRDNLFADGDFELTGRSGQMPWIAVGSGGQGTLTYATGGQCYSGIRCASIQKGSSILGYLAAPGTGTADVSVKVKTPTGKCADVSISIFDQTQVVASTNLFAGSPTADGTGWCVYRGVMKNFARYQPVVFVSTQSTTAVLVDDAIAQATTPLLVGLDTGMPPSSEYLDEAHAAIIWARSHQIFGLPRGRHVDDPPRNILPEGAE